MQFGLQMEYDNFGDNGWRFSLFIWDSPSADTSGHEDSSGLPSHMIVQSQHDTEDPHHVHTMSMLHFDLR